MKYMLLLRHEPETGPAEGTPEFDAEMAAWGEVMGELGQAGSMVAAHGLDTEATATTVRLRDGEELVTDGPFAETKEEFGGFYLIEAANLDEAIDWAARIPGSQQGSVEIRPVMVFDEAGNLVEEATA